MQQLRCNSKNTKEKLLEVYNKCNDSLSKITKILKKLKNTLTNRRHWEYNEFTNKCIRIQKSKKQSCIIRKTTVLILLVKKTEDTA